MRERSSNSETNVSRDVLVTKLQGELIILRTKADLTQEELASVIGLSRQTYCQIEKGNAKMAWSVYLALLLFFNSIPSTAELLPLLGIEVESILCNLNNSVRS